MFSAMLSVFHFLRTSLHVLSNSTLSIFFSIAFLAALTSCSSPVKPTERQQPATPQQPTQPHRIVVNPPQEPVYPIEVPDFRLGASDDFLMWLDQFDYRQQLVTEYQQYLYNHVGYAPPMEQMVKSARSWKKCGFEPYEVPPRDYWHNMVDTLKLLKMLRESRYFPENFTVVSVYRNPELNRCAKGSKGSKHMLNAAMDIRVHYADEYERFSTESNLCQFWNEQGDVYNFGLGIYKSGTIHMDTQGHRRWGSSHGSKSSPCSN